MKRVLTSLAAALALAVPALAQVAQIGDTTYADFNSFFTAFQAIAASETPTTVTLLDDLTGDLAVPGTVPVKEGQAIVFDLNGRTMETALQREGRHYYAIDNYGTLTIKDSSAGQTGTIRARGVQNLGNGKLTIEGGTIVSVDANGGACVWNEADVTIAGGTFTTEFVGTPSDSSGPGCLNNSGTALVTGGTFHNVNRRTYAIISNMGAIEITPAKGAEVKVFGAHGGLGVDGGTAVVNGGSYSSSDFYGLYVSNDGLGADPMQAAVTVNDGTFDGKSYSVWVGSDYNNPVNSTIAIKGGTFLKALNRQDVSRPNAIQVSGGTFSTAVPEEFCTAGYASKQNADGTYSVVGWYESGVDLDADGVADAWVIRNEGDLAAFRDKVNGNVTFAGCTVTLAANLDLAGVAWIPIGEGNAGGASKNGGFFAGTFEGGDHLIANLHVSETKLAEGAGLFGWVRGATIRNLRVSGSILANVNGAAGIIGVVESDYVGNLSTTIENVHNVGDTVRGSKAGGIVGEIRRGGTVAITGCTNAAAVTASINHSDQVDALCAGGIVGNAGGTSVAISGCSNSGAVTATPDEEGWTAETPTYAGGIVGRMGTGTLAAGNGDNTGAVSASGAGTVGQGAILGGMVAGTHPVVELALSQEEAEGGRATLFTGTSLDDASGLEVVPVLPEGMDEPDDFVVTLEDELFYCDLLYLADRVAGESEGVTFDANAQQALLNAAGGSMHGNIAVSGRTAVDKPLTTAQVNEALACFEGSGLIVVEGSLEGEKTLVVAYDFGITDVRVTGTGDLVVEVAAQDMSGRPLAFAEGATLSLRNGETALAATPATVEGVTTLTVPAANVPAGNLALSVSVAPAAAEEAPAN